MSSECVFILCKLTGNMLWEWEAVTVTIHYITIKIYSYEMRQRYNKWPRSGGQLLCGKIEAKD